MNPQSIADVLERAGHLFCLALAPAFLPPEPAASASSSLAAALSTAALVLVAFAAVRLRARFATREASAAAVLVVLSIIASVAFAAYFRGPLAPLGRGVLFVAVPLWAGLGLVVWAALGKRLSPSQHSTRVIAAVATLGLGVAQLGASSSWLGSIERMWWVTLGRDGNVDRALDELMKVRGREASSVLDQCLATNPTSCVCLSKRSELKRKNRDAEGALIDARLVVSVCPADPKGQATLANALVASDKAAEAEQTIRTALEKSQDPQLHYALAVALEAQGRNQDAIASARRSVDLGGGRDPALLVAALSIVAGDLDGAIKVLEPLVAASANDADARYDLALIADKKNDYNRAREGYLAALRADPKLANARYNLALLTLRRGVVEEARHHARKFAELAPGDPRAVELLRRIETTPARRP